MFVSNRFSVECIRLCEMAAETVSYYEQKTVKKQIVGVQVCNMSRKAANRKTLNNNQKLFESFLHQSSIELC